MDVPQFIAGRFRIEGEIGTGGMGTVYRATHLALERPVAVKIIKPEFAHDRDVSERFLREARTMARLRHPHAAMIFDAGNLPDGRYFIVMEYVEGPTLSEVLTREGRFATTLAIKIALEICDVLEEAHQLGIIHRDLKPSNIILNERGICVLDFGVAKVLAPSNAIATHPSTGSGMIIGTPRYMSPEQCLGQKVGARSDLYSLGVLLYEMLSGRPPFTDNLPSAVLVKQATAAPPPLPQLCPQISKQLATAVHTLLAKRPENRPQTAAHARILLERATLEVPSRAFESDPLSTTIAALGERRNTIARFLAPLALVLTLGALLLVWGHSGKTASPETTYESSPSEERPTESALMARKLPVEAISFKGSRKANRADSRPALSSQKAWDLAASNSRGALADVERFKTSSGAGLAAIQKLKSNQSQFFVMERRDSSYRISASGNLDTSSFRNGKWRVERLDVDQDDYDELLFTGVSRRGSRSAYRFLLYAPKKRETFSLQVEKDPRTRGRVRFTWSANALESQAGTYHDLLVRRATSAKKM